MFIGWIAPSNFLSVEWISVGETNYETNNNAFIVVPWQSKMLPFSHSMSFCNIVTPVLTTAHKENLPLPVKVPMK